MKADVSSFNTLVDGHASYANKQEELYGEGLLPALGYSRIESEAMPNENILDTLLSSPNKHFAIPYKYNSVLGYGYSQKDTRVTFPATKNISNKGANKRKSHSFHEVYPPDFFVVGSTPNNFFSRVKRKLWLAPKKTLHVYELKSSHAENKYRHFRVLLRTASETRELTRKQISRIIRLSPEKLTNKEKKHRNALLSTFNYFYAENRPDLKIYYSKDHRHDFFEESINKIAPALVKSDEQGLRKLFNKIVAGSSQDEYTADERKLKQTISIIQSRFKQKGRKITANYSNSNYVDGLIDAIYKSKKTDDSGKIKIDAATLFEYFYRGGPLQTTGLKTQTESIGVFDEKFDMFMDGLHNAREFIRPRKRGFFAEALYRVVGEKKFEHLLGNNAFHRAKFSIFSRNPYPDYGSEGTVAKTRHVERWLSGMLLKDAKQDGHLGFSFNHGETGEEINIPIENEMRLIYWIEYYARHGSKDFKDAEASRNIGHLRETSAYWKLLLKHRADNELEFLDMVEKIKGKGKSASKTSFLKWLDKKEKLLEKNAKQIGGVSSGR